MQTAMLLRILITVKNETTAGIDQTASTGLAHLVMLLVSTVSLT